MSAVTMSEYARRKGVTPGAIHQAVKSDKIQLNDAGLVETEDADANYTPGKVSTELAKAKTVREHFLAKKAKLDYEKSVEATAPFDKPFSQPVSLAFFLQAEKSIALPPRQQGQFEWCEFRSLFPALPPKADSFGAGS